MSKQSEIFAKYRSLFNSSTVRPTDSPTNKKLDQLDFVDFLFELVKSTKGVNEFKNIVLKGCLGEIKQTQQINQLIINALKTMYGCDNNLIIPGKYTTESVTGISMTKTEIDIFGLFKFDPDSIVGSFLYDGNDITKHVNYFLYKAQTVNKDQPIVFKYKGQDLFTIYAQDSETFIFKFGLYYKNKQYSLWLDDYLNAINPIFNFTNFMTMLVDLITGTISIAGNKNKIEITQQSTIITALQKMFGFCSESLSDNDETNGSIRGFLNNQNNNTNANQNNVNTNANTNGFGIGNVGDASGNSDFDYFSFNASELNDINTDADLRSQGLMRFSTCGDLDVAIDSADVIAGLTDLFNNANDNLLNDYSNLSTLNTNSTTNNGTYDNNANNLNLNGVVDFFDSTINKGLQNTANQGEDTVANNVVNITSEMQLNILKAIPYALMEMVLSPKLLIIPKTHAVLTGDDSTKPINDLVNSLAKIINKIGTQITKKLLQNIFDSIKSDLTKLAKSLAVAYLKQRGIDYLACLSSLLSLLNLLSDLTDDGGCQSILGKLLKLLSLGGFGPMPPIPPPLVLFGGALKPGLNHVSMVNDVKSALEEKGIVTAPTMADGTPNNMMIAIEEAIKVMVKHIKTNANISVTTTGIGLAQGYGQIQ